MAEEDFLQLLIANERIGRTLDILCDPYQCNKYALFYWLVTVHLFAAAAAAAATAAAAAANNQQQCLADVPTINPHLVRHPCRHQHAITQLQQDLQRGPSYVEEVGVAQVVKKAASIWAWQTHSLIEKSCRD